MGNNPGLDGIKRRMQKRMARKERQLVNRRLKYLWTAKGYT